MLHVILLILKILGILLLSIIVLFLLAVYAVLFVSASYRIQVRKEEEIQIFVRTAWLFRILTFHYRTGSGSDWEPEMQFRLFGLPIQKFFERKRVLKGLRQVGRKVLRRPDRAEPDQETPKTGKKNPDMPEATGDREGQNAAEEAPGERASDQDAPWLPEKEVWEEESQKFTEYSRTDSGKKTAEAPPPEKKTSFFRKIVCAIRRIRDKIKNIWKKTAGIKNAVRKLSDRKDALLEFWQLEEHRRARSAIREETVYLWKKLRPRKIKGKIRFGFSDPSTTGLCMGGVGMLCAWYPKELRILPDFEQEVLEGDILIRGKVQLFVLLRVLWRIYTNPDIQRMYDHWEQF